ncbi:hypothetical protein [Priestia aryabhattai]|uniref:hypothetical protein n=1 Tax=Priestia aryabhattai TaxID=412384 RepID=UPI0020169D3B|nr:hypothetical protein [Priestia aryabhattai]
MAFDPFLHALAVALRTLAFDPFLFASVAFDSFLHASAALHLSSAAFLRTLAFALRLLASALPAFLLQKASAAF